MGTDSHPSTKERTTALEAANADGLYVLCGFYSDKSGFKLFGIYEVLSAAEDRRKLMQDSGCLYEMRVVKMPLNRCNPQSVS